MKTMTSYLIIATFALVFNPQASHAYGSGGGSSSGCSEPTFYDEMPPKNSAIKSLSEFGITASANTEIASLDLQVNGSRISPAVQTLRSGEFQLTAKLPSVLTQAGKVRITLAAKSKDGCSAFYPLYLEIKP